MRALFAIALLALALPHGTAHAETDAVKRAADHTVTIVNRTSNKIQELHASLSSENQWGSDRLGDSVIAPGHNYALHLNPPGSACDYDFRVKYAGGKAEERRNVNICRTSSVIFDGSKAKADSDDNSSPGNGARHAVTIINHSPREISEIYISGKNDSNWGSDKLGDDTLSAGHRFDTNFNGDCTQDLRIVYDNKSAEERHDINFCAHAEVEVKLGWTLPDDLGGSVPHGGGGQGDSDSNQDDHRI